MTHYLKVLAALSCALLLAEFGLAGRAIAQSPQTTPHCAGDDMLAEYEDADPAGYAKVMAAAKAMPNTDALLWKVDKPGLVTSFLFGTVHLSDPRVTTFSPAVTDALTNANTIALEVADLSDGAVAKAMINAASLVTFSDGQSLEKLLTPEEFSKVKAILSKNGMPGELSPLFKPWIVSLLLSVSDCERQKVAGGAIVLDMKIAAEAGKLNKQVVGLETADEQLRALAGVSDDQQLGMLRAALKYADRTDDVLETIIQRYLKRQMGAALPFQIAMAEKAGVPASAFSDFQRILLTERNVRMRDNSIALLEKGAAFIAVGALHLPGEDGLVDLLRESGYTLTPVE